MQSLLPFQLPYYVRYMATTYHHISLSDREQLLSWFCNYIFVYVMLIWLSTPAKQERMKSRCLLHTLQHLWDEHSWMPRKTFQLSDAHSWLLLRRAHLSVCVFSSLTVRQYCKCPSTGVCMPSMCGGCDCMVWDFFFPAVSCKMKFPPL